MTHFMLGDDVFVKFLTEMECFPMIYSKFLHVVDYFLDNVNIFAALKVGYSSSKLSWFKNWDNFTEQR